MPKPADKGCIHFDGVLAASIFNLPKKQPDVIIVQALNRNCMAEAL
jgi:hypothetical protein